MSGTPNTPRCIAARSDKLLTWDTNWLYTNWPESTEFTAPMRLVPYSLSTLVSAILVAEAAGHHVRAVGEYLVYVGLARRSPHRRCRRNSLLGLLVYTSNLVSGITRNGVPFFRSARYSWSDPAADRQQLCVSISCPKRR